MNGLNGPIISHSGSIEHDAARDEVVAAIQQGSSSAFTELYAAYSRRLYNTIIAITKNHQDAEDALQDTYLRAYLSIQTFEGRSSVYSWLTRIAINSALIMLRRKRARPEMLFDSQPDGPTEEICFEISDPAPTPERLCELRQHQSRVLRAIDKLDACLRGPLRMRIANEATLLEIGHALNISEGAVKSRLYRARQRLYAAGAGAR
jgi:RNA polymerase sigma-70 factor, ECF subfamily